jgi:prepilin-type N-terminal cleavage/methylation domain-containing protein
MGLPAVKTKTKISTAGKLNSRFRWLPLYGKSPLQAPAGRSRGILGKVRRRNAHASATQRGYTLIELIVVIALISIMLAVVVPRLDGSLFADDSKVATRWLLINIPALKTKAVRDQTVLALRFSLSEGKAWVVGPETSEEAAEKYEAAAYSFPEGIKILDIDYPDRERVSSGEADIFFYPKGYSDWAIIHMEDSDGNRYSFLVEPFLPQIKRLDEYLEF